MNIYSEIDTSIADERRFNAALRLLVQSYASFLMRKESSKQKVDSPIELRDRILNLMTSRREHLRQTGPNSMARSIAAMEIDRLIAQIRAIRVAGDPS
jgi:hypothetical protein